MPTLFHNQQPFINLHQIFIKQPFIDLFETYSKPLYYQTQVHEPQSDNQYEAMPESDNRTETDQPQSDNRTKEGEPNSDNPYMGFRMMGKSDGISNTDALNNTNLYKESNKNNSNSKNQQHDYAVILKSSTRYDIEALINEKIFQE